MKNVAELVRKPAHYRGVSSWKYDFPLPDTDMGIEVEVERDDTTQLPSSLLMWRTTRDGSLVNGVEYVLSRPMYGNDLRAAINELFRGSVFTRSLTGSTHIHMNMLEDDVSTETLRTMVMLVYALEPMLYAAGDPSREWCGYANRLMAGPDSIIAEVMRDDISSERFQEVYSRNTSQFGRYYGLNMAALLDYGSLEFRYFPTATSEEELLNWVELVQTFRKAAQSIGSRSALTDIMEEESMFNDMLNKYFGKWQHLFESLGKHSEVRGNYRKALITARVTQPDRYSAFRPIDVLGNGRFSNLLKFAPAEVESAPPYTIVDISNGERIPRAGDYLDGAVLIYNRQVYHNNLNDSVLHEADAQYIDWMLLSTGEAEQIRRNPRLVATLNIVDEQYEINNSMHDRITFIVDEQ